MRTRGHSPLATRSRRRTHLIPRVDALEERRLMAVAFVETPLRAPSGSFIDPYLVAHASDGAVWTVSYLGQPNSPNPVTSHVTRTDPLGLMSDVTGLPAGDTPIALFAGDKGTVWAVTDTPDEGGHVVKLATDYNVVGSVPDTPLSATLGSDGDIWITTWHAKGDQSYTVEKFDPRTGFVSSYTLPGGSRELDSIASASDGSLWAVETESRQIARLNVAGQFTEYPLGFFPTSVTAGSNGSVWVAGSDVNGNTVIDRVSTDGTATPAATFPITPFHVVTTNSASWLAAAPDGSLWFINSSQEAIGHLKADDSLDYFPLSQVSETFPASLTTDGGTGFYFVQMNGSRFVHLLTDAPDPSVLLTANSIEHMEGALPSGITIASFTTTDATAFPFDFIARYQIDNQLPQVGTVLSDGHGGFIVQTSGADPVQKPGPVFLSVTVLDAKHDNSIGAKSSGIGVVTIDYAPVTVQAKHVSATAGVAFTGTVATLFDPDGNLAGDAQTQSTIDWGDGYSSSVVTTGSFSGNALVSPSGHAYANAGRYNIAITASHGGTVSTGSSTADVTIPAITSITPVTAGYSQGHESNAEVATFETASPSVAANYSGESSAPPDYWRWEHVVQVGPTSFEVWATANFSSWGEQGFAVYVEPNTGPWSNVQGDAIVTPAPITASVLPIPVVSDDTGVYGFAHGDMASFSSANPQAKASDYRATITSSDGGLWDASVVADSKGGFLVEGDHKFPTTAAAGTFDLTIKIDNQLDTGQVANGATLTTKASVAAFTLTLGVASGVTATTPEGASWVGYIGSFTPTNPRAQSSDFSVNIRWDDGSPDSPGSISPLGGGPFLIGVGHVFSIGGDHTATIDIVSPTGDHATATATFHVVPPPFVATGSALTGTQGTAISGVVATFRDATPSTPSDYSATIDWGDGTTSVGTVSTYQDYFVVYGSHVYATSGPRAYGVIMQENGGTPVTTTGTVIVADPAPVAKPPGTPAGGGPVGGGPMTIVSARSIRGKHGLIRVVVTLSGTVDPASISNVGGYVLSEPGKVGKHRTKDKIDTITSATYDPATKTLTLVPRGSFRRPVAFRVALRGSAGVAALAS